jgi:hypothetical protein
MWRPWFVRFLAFAITFGGARALRAQELRPAALHLTRDGKSRHPVESGTAPAPVPRWITRPDRPAPWWAPALSAAVPGAGQFALGQQRSVGYLVAEGYLLLQQVRARRDANRERDAYRTLAFEVARSPFGGARPRGSWSYYESMEQYLESGAFDRIPGGALDPETDETTYNGARWLLARETYWLNPAVPPAMGSPEYQRALSFYQSKAVPDAYRWSWRDARLQQDVYAQTIASANRGVQRAVNYAGLVGANHLVSLIDAYVSVRIRRYGGAGVAGVSVESVHTAVEPVGDPRDGRRQWRAAVRLVPAGR